jgi:high affinity sulfate transporter 1
MGPSSPALTRLVPLVGWVGTYRASWLRADALAGVAVLALVVPESLAYAGVAGVPVQYGLYAVPLAAVATVVFASSRHLYVGPSSTVAALSAATLAESATTANPIAVTAVISLVVGSLYVALSLLRMGFVAQFFARPVLAGFILGLGLYIAVGQLPALVGIEKPAGNTVEKFAEIITDIGSWSWTTVALGAASLTALIVLERIAPRLPGVVIVVVAVIVASEIVAFEDHGIEVVGDVPSGFDFADWTGVDLDLILDLVPGALGIILVGFAQSIAIAKSYAVQHGETVDANQELFSYGIANVGAGVLQGITVTGSLSKTATAERAGARSPIAFLFVAAGVVLTIVALAPVFESLPEATLAAVVISALLGMLDPSALLRLWRARVMDRWLALGALAGVLLIDILPGIVVGVGLSLVLFIHRLDHPRVAVLGRAPDGTSYADIDAHADHDAVDGVLVVRHDAPLIFCNAEAFVDAMRALLRARDDRPDVVVDLEAAFEVDTTGLEALWQVRGIVAGTGRRLVLARARHDVVEFIDRVAEQDGQAPLDHHPTVGAAVTALQSGRL